MKVVQYISDMIVPVLIFVVILSGMCAKKNVYNIFNEGSREALGITVDIVPSIIGLMMAIGMMNECGAIEILVDILRPFLSFIGLPPEVLPLSVLRPVSGSASMGIVGDVFEKCGPDSYAGRVASVMMGSTETTFYTIALFYGTIKSKVSGRVVVSALAGDFAGMLASVIFCQLFW